MSDVLKALFSVIEERKTQDPDQSYVASLHHKGLNKILEKVGEESIEVLLAAKDAAKDAAADDQKTEVIKEVADLWFHSMVMLSHLNIDQQDVQTELANRFGVSGLEEKRNRSANQTQSSANHNSLQDE